MDSELKFKIMSEIENNVPVFKKVSNIRWKIRCPFCGDSQKDYKDAHLYLKCDYDNPNEPILYNCFLANCQVHGKVTKQFMNKLGIRSKVADELVNQRYSKLYAFKEAAIDIITGTPIINSPQITYIESRLGSGFTLEDYDRFKIIWDIGTVYQYISDEKTLNTLPSNIDSISMLSDDKSTLLSRGFLENDNWRKVKIVSSNTRLFYTIKTVFNLFTDEVITVNIAEGIFDVLSIYKNFNDGPNSVFIATLGPDYAAAVNYAIVKGLVGTNVVLKIYADGNVSEKKLKFQLKKYKYFFKEIIILKNIKYKDVGVTMDKIELVTYNV